MLAGVAILVPACGGGSSDVSDASSHAAVVFSDPGIETFPDEGHDHVPVGTVVPYQTDPPTSGNHYPDPQPGGFYDRPIASGFLVHSMEHGGVIIYYDQHHVSKKDLDALRSLADAHRGNFSQVVVVPRNDSDFPIILTAWTHRLRLIGYDADRVHGFLALFLGNGPEAAPHTD